MNNEYFWWLIIAVVIIILQWLSIDGFNNNYKKLKKENEELSDMLKDYYEYKSHMNHIVSSKFKKK
jgi:hypothetical protein